MSQIWDLAGHLLAWYVTGAVLGMAGHAIFDTHKDRRWALSVALSIYGAAVWAIAFGPITIASSELGYWR